MRANCEWKRACGIEITRPSLIKFSLKGTMKKLPTVRIEKLFSCIKPLVSLFNLIKALSRTHGALDVQRADVLPMLL